ncbi:glycerol-3-phosphate dehydrogenase [Trichonephila clavipes]|nr:glycerol-3-phosphate dehydrogenase [Trichonephila clavipes]
MSTFKFTATAFISSLSSPAVTTSSSAQAQLLPSISSTVSAISDPMPPTSVSDAKEKTKEQPSQAHGPRNDAATNSEPQPPIPTSNDAASTNKMFTRFESSSSIIPTSSSKFAIQTPSDSNTAQDTKKISNARARKRKKELLNKMNDAIIEIKMAPHRRRKPAPEEYTTDEDMITYDVEEDEIVPNPDLVEKDEKQYWKGSLLLTPTRSRKQLFYN